MGSRFAHAMIRMRLLLLLLLLLRLLLLLLLLLLLPMLLLQQQPLAHTVLETSHSNKVYLKRHILQQSVS